MAAAGGRVAWKAVSKHATAGTSGMTREARARAASAGGWWSGARSVRAVSSPTRASSTAGGSRPAAAVHHPVAHGVGRAQRPERLDHLVVLHPPAVGDEVGPGDDPVVLVEESQLQAAGAGVDDEDAHRGSLAGPAPVGDLGQVLAGHPGVGPGPEPAVDHLLAQRRAGPVRAPGPGRARPSRGGTGRGRSSSPCRRASSSCPPPCSRARGCCRGSCAGSTGGG